ncbi:hypothetical protein I0C86_09200 [Plantactinospora sp. S1510]|uniref:CRISPR-associated protein n=1 Tax=Plantactinospora alkalitolerans TaxID=2789879 RepID=A0ABS0GSI3_9ACTN|nr:hypothetical protein [Plantactinospora alkalitolerans]MBF9129152.1 hypothetical protein [Plantactinospora alkalitolerans]
MRLLVHVAGEADLLLESRNRSEEVGAERVAKRCRDLAAALAGPDGPATARQMLTRDAWQDEPLSTPAPSPLLGALDALDATPDLTVVVLGTSQNPPRPLDTLPIAQTLADVLDAIAANDGTFPARKATVLAVPKLTETSIVDMLTSHLGEAPPYRQAVVTWGSGSTALTMGVLTALSHAGLQWQLVLTSESATYRVVDPLEQLNVDPVVGVFVRWRMFAALDDLAGKTPPAVQLTETQRDLVRQAAKRHADGFAAHDCASLRAVLADAVVRRDGSASLAVRRYITRRYEELLANDKVDHPWAADLLLKYERPKGGPPLGAKLRMIGHTNHDDPMVCASTDLPSYKWLYSPEANSLQNIGKGSHNLRPPAPCDARIVGNYLSRYTTDEAGWRDAGLPEPPVIPADTILAVWLAGTQIDPRVGSVGQQLSDGIPTVVLDHLGVEETRIRAVIFGVDDGQGSRDHADADAELIANATYGFTGEPRGQAWVEPIELSKIDPVAVERAIESRLTRETGALLLIPTGPKPIVLTLLHAVRHIGARHGIPLFVRQTADPETQGTYPVHLWPALTGGDLPLLNAAKKALHTLELDVAWRLLAASAIHPEITNNVRRLADTFASRTPLQDTASTSASDRTSRTMDLIAARLELVSAALAHATTPASQIHLLVLAADAMEASVAAGPERQQPGERNQSRPGEKYRHFRDGLRKDAQRHDKPEAVPARILLLLNEARDRAPITHGTRPNPDDVVADAADHLAARWQLTPLDADMLPRNVSTLLHSAVVSAADRGLGRPNQPDSLLRLHREVIMDINQATNQREPTRDTWASERR